MNNFRRWDIIFGWLSFCISAVVYFLTIEPTVSWWDCGEFITCSCKLEIGHPPGAPLFLLMGRIFSLFTSNPERVALMVNSLSALASAFTIMFLFWTITHLVKKIYSKSELSVSERIIITGSGLIGSLAFTFSDTFWFSAVEAEVYATSSLFTAVVFWAILRWEDVADEPHSNRWLIFIAYMMGLSIGVHLLNLLAIPAIVLVCYFRMYKITVTGVIKAIILSMVILGFIMYGIINGLVKVAAGIELLFVNHFGLGFNTGLIFFFLSVIVIICFGIWITHRKGKIIWNTVIMCIAVILIGYSSYAVIFIRSHANPPLDENNPDNIFSMMSYLNREQYGDRPLFFGHYFSDEIRRDSSGYAIIKESKPVYRKDTANNSYKVAFRKTSLTYSGSLKLFPRIYSRNPEYIEEYQVWGGIKNNRVTFANNLMFFINYQLGHMYLRYFMWNFAGRQNDTQSYGSLVNGNWISGIGMLDEMRLGNQDKLPDKYKNSRSRNCYYMFPLLMGILGLLFQLSRRKNDFWVVMSLFIMTGIAIVIYLNQTPLQPRERDYAYAGSFYAFCIWIGFGIPALFDLLRKNWQNRISAITLILLMLLIVPGIMARANWDDHDRSGRYIARDIARNYLAGCDRNAILFTFGDNDTFPLWYVQEVEGFRTDIRIVNLMLLNTEWYIDQLKYKANEADPLPLKLPAEKYAEGVNNYVYVMESPDTMNVKSLIEGLINDHPMMQAKTKKGTIINVLPTANLMLEIDSEKVLKDETVKPENEDGKKNVISWTLDENPISKANLIQLDLLAHNDWDKQICFTTSDKSGTLNMERFFELNGFTYKLVPVKSMNEDMFLRIGRVDPDELYQNLMFRYRWWNMDKPGINILSSDIRMLDLALFRNNFIRLAEELINKKETDKAVEVVDRCMEIAPHNILPYDRFISGFTYSLGKGKENIHYPGIIEIYYKCGEFSKGNTILRDYLRILKQNLIYYSSLSNLNKRRFENEMNESMILINELMILADNYKQKGLIE